MALGPLGLIDLDSPPPTLADHPIELAETYLVVPSGPFAGEPLELTDEQIEFLIAWYAVSSDGRRYVWRRGGLVGPKGYSKSPIGMVCAFASLVGDVVPDGLDAHGSPVGRPHPLPNVQIAGVSEDATDNLYGQLFEGLRDSPAIDELGVDVGVTKTVLVDRPGSIEPVTASANSRTGNPISDIYREETWLWKRSNGGLALAAALNQNARKMGARILDLTNPPVKGAGSVAERAAERVESGRSPSTLLVRIRRTDANGEPVRLESLDDDAVVRQALREVYGSHCKDGGGWVDLDELLDDRPPGETTEAEWRRLYLGEDAGAGDDDVIDVVAWPDLELADAVLELGDTIALGFDGSDVSDATALYACRWPDWCVFELGVWERPRLPDGRLDPNWRVPRLEVLALIREVMSLYTVVRGYADPAYWQSDIDELAAEYGEAFQRFPHHSAARIGPAGERWSTMQRERTLRHDGRPTLLRHGAAAYREPCGPANAHWWRPQRRVEGHPIDAASAAITAVHALGDAVAEGDHEPDETGDDFAEVV